MAPLATAAIAINALGIIIGGVSQANALRAQASQRSREGERELEHEKRRLRREFGQQAVEAGASGLLGESFTSVFDAQAIEDAQFLTSIKQRTSNEVAALRSAATGTLIKTGIGAGSSLLSGFAGMRQAQRQAKGASDLRRAILQSTAEARILPGRNIFGAGRGTGFHKTPGFGAF